MNDNGSGVLFAALINRIFYETFNPEPVQAPLTWPEMSAHVVDMMAREAAGFFGAIPQGLFLIVNDPQSLRKGRFRQELVLLRNILQGAGWRAEVGMPVETRWDGPHLRWRNQIVSFVVNRSTIFFGNTICLAPLLPPIGNGPFMSHPIPLPTQLRLGACSRDR